MTSLVQESSASNRLAPARAAYRTILVHVEASASAGPGLTSAIALARTLDATLFGVAAETLPPVAIADPMGGGDAALLAALQEQIEENLSKAEDAFRLGAAGLQVEWAALEEIPVTAVARLSRCADLIVAGGLSSATQDRYRWCDPAELILRSGCPVLVAPANGGELAAEAVIVAWKDTREARRAVNDALPFLKSAQDVVVMAVCNQEQFTEAESQTFAVVQRLKRHGVEVRAKVVVGSADQIAAELDIAAGVAGADLIVAGGYGHSRLAEWVFGGVTRDLLKAPERFLLMSH